MLNESAEPTQKEHDSDLRTDSPTAAIGKDEDSECELHASYLIKTPRKGPLKDVDVSVDWVGYRNSTPGKLEAQYQTARDNWQNGRGGPNWVHRALSTAATSFRKLLRGQLDLQMVKKNEGYKMWVKGVQDLKRDTKVPITNIVALGLGSLHEACGSSRYARRTAEQLALVMEIRRFLGGKLSHPASNVHN